MPEADTLIVIWIRLICMAGKVNAGGYIFISPTLPYEEEQLAAVLHRRLMTVRLALKTFKHLGMLEVADNGDLFLPNFAKYQSIKGLEDIREATRIRVAAFRERGKGQLTPISTDVTLRNVTSNKEIREEKKRIEKKRIEKNINKINSWELILIKLKNILNQTNYNMWFKESVGIKQNKTEFIIGVSSEYKAQYIESNQKSLVEKLIRGETGLPLRLGIVLIDPPLDKKKQNRL